jgi:hypothetical protein
MSNSEFNENTGEGQLSSTSEPMDFLFAPPAGAPSPVRPQIRNVVSAIATFVQFQTANGIEEYHNVASLKDELQNGPRELPELLSLTSAFLARQTRNALAGLQLISVTVPSASTLQSYVQSLLCGRKSPILAIVALTPNVWAERWTLFTHKPCSFENDLASLTAPELPEENKEARAMVLCGCTDNYFIFQHSWELAEKPKLMEPKKVLAYQKKHQVWVPIQFMATREVALYCTNEQRRLARLYPTPTLLKVYEGIDPAAAAIYRIKMSGI